MIIPSCVFSFLSSYFIFQLSTAQHYTSTYSHTQTHAHMYQEHSDNCTLSDHISLQAYNTDIQRHYTPSHTTAHNMLAHTDTHSLCARIYTTHQASLVDTCLQTYRHPSTSRACSLSLLLISLLVFKGLFLPFPHFFFYNQLVYTPVNFHFLF